jgi:ribosomal protein L35AE/L33A
MSDESKSPFIGKYVCYNAVDGGACWGRIKDECKINTMDGEKDAFLLEGSIVAYKRATTGITAKVMKTGVPLPAATITLNPQTGQLGTDVEIEIRKFKGDTLIRKDVIDLERDVIDLDEYIGKTPEDTLFLALMRGRAEGLFGNLALEIGLSQLTGLDISVENRIKRELQKRLGTKQ